jgi:hypothetical protein
MSVPVRGHSDAGNCGGAQTGQDEAKSFAHRHPPNVDLMAEIYRAKLNARFQDPEITDL